MIIKTPIIVISGPTAGGKSKLAMIFAEKFLGSIINADSMQLYKNLPILTAQPSLEEQNIINHYLYGFLEANKYYNPDLWSKNVKEVLKKGNSNPVFLVGGTGLYLKSLIEGFSNIPSISEENRRETLASLEILGKEEFFKKLCILDPKILGKIAANDWRRAVRAFEVFKETGKSIIDFQSQIREKYFEMANFLHIVISPVREKLYQNCDLRFETMLKTGAIDEIKLLYEEIGDELYPVTRAHGYKEIVSYLSKKNSFDEAINLAKISTRQYAKRQITWFRHQFAEKKLIEYESFDLLTSQVNDLIEEFLNK